MTPDLTTTYLGLRLRTPLVPSASPLSEKLDDVKRMEDAGASAIVLHSLFEEEVRREREALHRHLTHGTESYAEALTYFPEPVQLEVGVESYLRQVSAAKRACRVPIIASLNGCTPTGWTSIAKEIQQAGADALELNVYFIPTDPTVPGFEVEQRYVDVLRGVKAEVTIPVAVKLGPYFSNFANMAKRLDESGANGLVLFNRFYQPDVELESLEIVPNLLYSTPMAMRVPLRWIAILYDQVRASLAATSGIHRATDALKMIMAGADVTMLCSVLMRSGIERIASIEREMREWMEAHEYESVEQMKGSLSQKNCPDPSAFERAQYVKAVGPRRRD